MFAAACDQLAAAVLPWPCQRGDEDTVLLDALGGFPHGRILPHLKGVIRERMQLRELYGAVIPELHLHAHPVGAGLAVPFSL